jgi:polyhydroxybutyrate depolymerase
MKNTININHIKNCVLTISILLFIQNISYAQVESGSFEFDGLAREYSVFLPQNYQPNMPVVINLHGYGQSLENIMGYTMMNDFADSAEFIVVYPVGNGHTWSSGAKDNRYLSTADDVGFISTLIDTLDAYYKINMARIYCTGFSNGGEMTYRLAAQLGHRIAAVASVCGGLNNSSKNWHPIRSTPILDINGTADPMRKKGFDWWSLEKSLNFWIQYNNCSLSADSVLISDIDTLDNCIVEKISLTDCSDTTTVIQYKIINGGHQWPGADAAFDFWNGGNFNNDINANIEMWNFFKNYQNPLAGMAWPKTASVFPKYVDQQKDTLFIKAYISNPKNHSILVYAKIKGEASFSDSTLLYDDGMHFDEYPNDNVWGNAKLLTGWDEDMYTLDIYAEDYSLETVFKNRISNHITTRGPVVFEDITYKESDPEPNPGDQFRVKLLIKNMGLTDTIPNVKARFVSLDTSVNVLTNLRGYDDIPPDGKMESDNYYIMEISENCPPNTKIPFELEISSNNHFFWRDTFFIEIVNPTVDINSKEITPKQFGLSQNYPNPFNPTTTITYELSKTTYVVLKIYDILGNEVRTLLNKQELSGYHSAVWDGKNDFGNKVSSGLFLYRLQAGDFVQTKKMMLLK